MTRFGEIIFCVTTFIAFVNCKEFSECSKQPDGTYIRGQNGCRSYIFCAGIKSYESSCPPGLYFDSITGICDDPANVDCIDGPGTAPVCPPTIPGEIVYLPSAESCSEFYVCRDGVPKPMACVTNLHFNALTQQCDSPDSANCKIAIADKPPTPSDQPTPATVSSISTTNTTPLSSSTSSKLPTTTGTQTPTPTSLTNSTPNFSPTSVSTATPTPTQQSTLTPIWPTTPQTPPSSWPPTVTDTPTTQPTPYFSSTPAPSSPPTVTGTQPASPTWPTGPPTPSSTWQTNVPTTQTILTTLQTTKTSSTPIWTTEAPPTTISAKDLCKQVNAGYFAYPDDCHFYYRCSGGELTKQECPNGFGWNVDYKMCTAAACPPKTQVV